MKNQLLAIATVLSVGVVSAEAVEPQVSAVTMSQADSRLVTISYSLANAPAVVTVDIETNCVAAGGIETWTSIGGENIQRLTGDVNAVVEGDGAHTITWRPDLSWPDHKVADGGGGSCRGDGLVA